MLNDIIFKVLYEILDGNIESVDCYFSGSRRVGLMTKTKISYKDFIRKTKYIVLEDDIANYDSDEEDLTFSIDLTEEFVNKIVAHVKCSCLNEFENMSKRR